MRRMVVEITPTIDEWGLPLYVGYFYDRLWIAILCIEISIFFKCDRYSQEGYGSKREEQSDSA